MFMLKSNHFKCVKMLSDSLIKLLNEIQESIIFLKKTNRETWDRIQRQISGACSRIDKNRNEVYNEIEKLKKIVADNEAVDCEKCGCMIKKSKAVEGKSEIREYFILAPLPFSQCQKKEIYTPHFCKRCAPKVKQEVKK